MAWGVWAKGLPAVALALALMGGGAARAQEATTVVICGVMMANAGHIMGARQRSVPRAMADAVLANYDKSRINDYMKWILQQAYLVEIENDPAKVPSVTLEFQGRVYDHCIVQDWP